MIAVVGEDAATFTAEPDNGGRPVTFEVRWRRRRGYETAPFVVGLKGSDGEGFSQHPRFEDACRAALSRATRYERAYSKRRAS